MEKLHSLIDDLELMADKLPKEANWFGNVDHIRQTIKDMRLALQQTHVSGALPSDDMINEAADKYGFRVPYDGSNKFYDDDAIKHFLAGVSWYRSALVGNDR